MSYSSHRKDEKRCATCSYWGGQAEPESSVVKVDSNAMGTCMKDKREYRHDRTCSKWERRF